MNIIIRSVVAFLIALTCATVVYGENEINTLNGYIGESIVNDPNEFDKNFVIYSDNTKEYIDYNQTLFYYNGQLQSDVNVRIINGESYCNFSEDFLYQELDVALGFDEGILKASRDNKVILEIRDYEIVDNKIYVPTSEFFEGIGMNVEYTFAMDEQSNSFVKSRDAVYVDKEYYTTVDVDRALSETKSRCLKGFENYKASFIESQGKHSLEDEYIQDLNMIQDSIENMTYMGEISKYYVFDMNLYRVFYDKVTGDVYLNYNVGYCTYTKFLDINSTDLYTPLFIVN